MSAAAALRTGAAPGPHPVVERVLGLAASDPRRALAAARRGLASLRGGEPAIRGQLLRALGHALRAVGSYAEARDAYRRARVVFRRLGLERERALCALGWVDACMYLGRTREALRVAADARRVFGRHRDRSRLAKLETNLGNLHHHLEALEPALVHYERAARLFGRDGSPAERATVDHNRANILTHLGRRREAEALYRRARGEFEEAGMPVLAAQARYGLACLRFLSGEYAAAISELEEVRPSLARLGARPLLALADLDLAEVLVAMRLDPEALALARAASRWFRARRLPAQLARSELLAGVALARLGDRDEAARRLAAADRTFRSQGHAPGRAAVALARARIEAAEARPLAAARQAMRARAIFRRAGFPSRALAAAAVAAESLLAAGGIARARGLARLMLHEPRHPGDAYTRARLARVEAMAAARAGDRDTALRCYRSALDEAGRAHSALFVDEWRMGFLEGEPAMLDESLDVLLSRRPPPRPVEVWRWIARFRAARSPASFAPRPGASPPVRERAASLQAELEACYSRLWRLGDGVRRAEPEVARGVERRALDLERRLRRLAGSPAPAPARPAAGPGSEDPTGRDETRLFYFAAGGRLGALRLDADGWELAPDLAPVEEIERLIRLFHYQMDVLVREEPFLADRRTEVVVRAREHLATLSRLALEPALRRRGPRARLRIAPHGALYRLPFHALPWRGAALVEGCEVSIDPWFGDAVPARAPRRRGAWVVGSGGARAGAIEREALRIGRVLAREGVAVERRVAARARVSCIREAAREAALIHVTGHAMFRREHPEFSAVRLADGWVSARDLAALPLRGACVVLSACETGPRGVVAGDEMLGLARGLVRAGARAVVTSLWPVNDRATLELMGALYERWAQAGRLGAALQGVQRRSARAGRDPHLWAPFFLMGDPDVPWPGRVARG